MRWKVALAAASLAGASVAVALPAAAAPPSAPTITYLHGGPDVGQMTIKWSAPISNGGTAITSYEYQYKVDAGAWSAGGVSFAPATSKAVVACPAPQSPGHGCSFQLRANNGAPGPWSVAKSAVWAKPTAPTLVSAVAGTGTGQARLQFKPPTSNGGLAVTSYKYAVYNGAAWSAPSTIDAGAIVTVKPSPPGYATTVSCPITTAGGPAGCKYKMYAVNAVASSVASAVKTAPLTVPGTVQNLKAATNSVVLGSGSAAQTVSWDAPLSNGGLDITHTTLFACTTSTGSVCKDFSPPSDWTAVSDYAGSPSSVSTTYTCPENGRCGYEVKAFNAIGASFVVAYSRPAPPTSLAVTPSTTQAGAVNLAWAGTFDLGASFGHYVLFECGAADNCSAGSWTSNAADAAPWSKTNLAGTGTATSFSCGVSTPCTFRIGYVDSAGKIGGVTNEVTAVGLDAPTVTATANGSPGAIDVSWTPPSTTATITGYRIDRDTGSGFSQLTVVGASTTSFTDSFCTPGASCGYRVTAFFTVGTSATSSAQYATAAGDTAVAITDPSASATVTTATPTFSGTAGSAAADSATLTVTVYSGADTTGNVVETLSATRSGSLWSIDATTLADGTYTVQAAQTNYASTVVTSAPVTFSVNTSGP